MLPEILIALLPTLVQEAEKLFIGSGTGPQKKDWVTGFVTNIVTDLDRKGLVPSWLKPEEGILEGLLSTAIESALDKAGL